MNCVVVFVDDEGDLAHIETVLPCPPMPGLRLDYVDEGAELELSGVVTGLHARVRNNQTSLYVYTRPLRRGE